MLDRYEYTFFHREIAEKFIDQLNNQHTDTQIVEEEGISGDPTFTVIITAALNETDVHTIESIYEDLLFGEQAALVDGNDTDGALADVCGVQLALKDGSFTTVAIEPDIMNKLLSVLSIEEIQQFMNQVAEDIETPKTGPICRRNAS